MTQELTPCLGWRYNFKKGTEYCPNADKCEAHKLIGDSLEHDDHIYQKVRQFKSIKEFRQCKEHKNSTL